MFSGKTAIDFSSLTQKSEYDGTELGGKTKMSTFTVNPSFGYFVIDNLWVGLSSEITSTKNEYGGNTSKTSELSLLPTVGYYFPVDGKVKPYIQAGIGFASAKQVEEYDGGKDEAKFSGLGYSAGLGVDYFINNNVAFGLGVAYGGSNLKYSEDKKLVLKNNGITLGLGFSIFL
ncbi:MAG: porin family protein [Flavobacteriales bacterium]|nr:porin family protein [Flavobacteriales bacterium]